MNKVQAFIEKLKTLRATYGKDKRVILVITVILVASVLLTIVMVQKQQYLSSSASEDDLSSILEVKLEPSGNGSAEALQKGNDGIYRMQTSSEKVYLRFK